MTLLPSETSAFCLQYLRDASDASLCSLSFLFHLCSPEYLGQLSFPCFSSLSDFLKVPLETIFSFVYVQIISFTTPLVFWNSLSYVSGVFYNYT